MDYTVLIGGGKTHHLLGDLGRVVRMSGEDAYGGEEFEVAGQIVAIEIRGTHTVITLMDGTEQNVVTLKRDQPEPTDLKDLGSDEDIWRALGGDDGDGVSN